MIFLSPGQSCRNSRRVSKNVLSWQKFLLGMQEMYYPGRYPFTNEPAHDEPPHDKTNKMACAPSEDSDQPGHPLRSAWASSQSDQSLHCPHAETLGPWLPIEHTAKTGHTSFCFVMLRLNIVSKNMYHHLQ